MSKNQAKIRQVGIAFAAVGAATAAAGGLAIKAAVDFESAMTGVAKTVDATGPELEAMGDAFQQLSTEIPITANELAGIAETAGQLGIAKKNIVEFSEVMAGLGVATNLTAEEAATAMARLANVTGLPQDQFENLASSLVDLGNNLATTEGEILLFGQRIAGAGNLAGLTEAQILAIGGAMSSVGVQAEAGGTAVQKVLLDMDKAVNMGTENLHTFARVAGLSAEEFAQSFEQDAGNAFTLFVEGLGKSGKEGQSILAELGLEDQRLIRSFLSLGNAGDLLRQSMDLSTKAFAENSALAAETEKRYATAASQITMFKNEVTVLMVEIGKALIPILRDFIDIVRPVIRVVTSLAERFPVLAKVIGIVGVALGVLGVVMVALPAVMGVVSVAMGAMTVAITGVTIALGILLSPIGLVVLAIAGIVTAAFVFRDEVVEAFVFTGDKIQWVINNVYIRAINVLIEGLNLLPGVSLKTIKPLDIDFRTMAENVKTASEGAVTKLKDLAAGIFGVGEKSKTSFEHMSDVVSAAADLKESGGSAVKPVNDLRDAIVDLDAPVKTMVDRFGGFETAVKDARVAIADDVVMMGNNFETGSERIVQTFFNTLTGELTEFGQEMAGFEGPSKLVALFVDMRNRILGIFSALKSQFTTLAESFENNFNVTVSASVDIANALRRAMEQARDAAAELVVLGPELPPGFVPPNNSGGGGSGGMEGDFKGANSRSLGIGSAIGGPSAVGGGVTIIVQGNIVGANEDAIGEAIQNLMTSGGLGTP
jgi:TP901 family phage tail tape measure protein